MLFEIHCRRDGVVKDDEVSKAIYQYGVKESLPGSFYRDPLCPARRGDLAGFHGAPEQRTTAPENVGEALCAACEWGWGIAEKH